MYLALYIRLQEAQTHKPTLNCRFQKPVSHASIPHLVMNPQVVLDRNFCPVNWRFLSKSASFLSCFLFEADNFLRDGGNHVL